MTFKELGELIDAFRASAQTFFENDDVMIFRASQTDYPVTDHPETQSGPHVRPAISAVTEKVAWRNHLGYTVTVIKSFKSKALAELFETGKSRKVQPKHVKRLTLILTALNAASQARQMNMPGMRFHGLKGGRLAVWVDENYRVTFKFDGGHAYEVDYEDYH
jgi:toxin HigB-1